MAVKSSSEILEIIKNRIGDATDDDTLAFLEDITDTLSDYDTRISESGDWKTKYEENDNAWRQKYKARFFSDLAEIENTDEVTEESELTENELLSYDELFKKEE